MASAELRKAVEQLRKFPMPKTLSLPMREDICLSISGVVIIPGVGWMHPEYFKDVAGQEAYDELLRRPRIVTEYD